jgi:P-type Cu2+ transporter
MNHTQSVVLEISGVQWASSKAVAEVTLLRRPGVVSVEANPVSQTANVSYDPDTTNVAELRSWVEDCGFHCAGQSVPAHICDPMEEPVNRATVSGAGAHGEHDHMPGNHTMHSAPEHGGHGPAAAEAGPEAEPAHDHMAHEHGTAVGPVATTPPAATAHEHAPRTAQDVMGHGGHGGGASMDEMVRDMRNRFLVAAILSIPIVLWSPIGRDVFGFTVPAPVRAQG